MWSVLSTTVYLIALFFWPLYRPSFIYVECFVHHCLSYCPFLLAIIPPVLHLCGVFCPPLFILLPFSFGHYTVRPSFMWSVLSTTVYLIALFFWPLYRPSFIDLCLMITLLASSNLCETIFQFNIQK